MRKSGVLMHISSLPSPYGIGTLGSGARDFVDFLRESSQSYWQVLPISPTGYGDSPYQSFSSYAGNPYFIDLDELCAQGYLLPEEFQGLDWGGNPERTDYGKLYENRFKVLFKAAERLSARQEQEYYRFCSEQSSWLEDYALFMALKNKNGGAPWTSWEDPLRFREEDAIVRAQKELGREIESYKAMQYFFHTQWRALREYANSNGVEIIGDIPIYAAPDSADVWSHPEFFDLDKQLRFREVAGCPPDGFSEDGQLWGNPLYNWDALREDNFGWWVNRIDFQLKLFDVLRIDHFRGLDSYYAIPAGEKTARLGVWRQGPGIDLLNAIGQRRIIAEDLGFLTQSVHKLLQDSGYPGMKVLQFAFDSREESDYLPHNFIHHCVAYTGTHDNTTATDWFVSAAPEDVALARAYMRIAPGDDEVSIMLRTLWSSVADLAIACMQDLLRLDGRARMNTPGVLGGNWQWRMSPEQPLAPVGARLLEMTRLYGRG
jgi:4-alpha-glucanotransferase